MSKIGNVVIVGRMNVGKSTLFNRLATSKKSLTLDYNGVTRDFIKDTVDWNNTTFNLIDTGGITFRKITDPLLQKVRAAAEAQVTEADLVLFVCDGTVGLLPEDREIANAIRKMNKEVVVIINKMDVNSTNLQIHEFDKLSFARKISISAQHGTGIADLLELITQVLTSKSLPNKIESPIYKVVLLGKPNVGKSSLMNLLVKQERSIVLDMPGTTREALSQEINFYNKKIELIDTPGIRRKSSVAGELEPMMVKNSFAALKDSDIVILLIDAHEGPLADQELKLAFYAFEEQHKALILLTNKQDLITEESERKLEICLDYYKHIINKIPVLRISCKTGKNIGRILPLLDEIWESYSKQFDNEELNKLFISSLSRKPLFHKGKRLVLYAAQQLNTAPITLLLKVNKPEWFKESQLSFFENILRANYSLKGIPIKFIVRSK